jgi:tetratricopeptide (TPR) repeat protein
METTNVIIVTEDTTTGAATIEVLPMPTETSSNLVTEIIEAILDPAGDDVETDAMESNDSTVAATTYSVEADALDTTASVAAFDTTAPTGFEASAMNATFATASDAASVISSSDAATEIDAATQAHADAAAAAQAQADEAVARGDYEAAAYHREVAENEAYAAGDYSGLQGSDSTELENAAWQQDQANYYEQQQAQHAQAGAYEAAREDAANAAYAHGNADWQAGGSDHSGQAQLEQHQMDWAVWEEGNADYYAQQADAYAAQGDYDNAATSAAEAAEHQATADYHGDLGEHGGSMAVYDPASEVTADTSYSSYDYSSSYDASSSYSSADYSSSYDASSSSSE